MKNRLTPFIPFLLFPLPANAILSFAFGFLMLAANPVFCSSFQINGNVVVPCPAIAEEYSVPLSAQQTVFDKTYQLHWEVTGGKFENGKSKFTQNWPDFAPVTIRWNYSSDRTGKLTAQLTKENSVIQSAIHHVIIGLPDPIGVTIEGDYLNCTGNWFEVKTEVPLLGLAIVEWQVKNGLDENDVPVRFLSRRGMDANRLYLKKEDHTLPLEISVRLTTNCEKGTKRTQVIKETFHNPPARIIVPSEIRSGQENTFNVCPITGKGSPRWKTSGTILEETAGTAIIYFDEPGEETIQIFMEDCTGKLEEFTTNIHVNPPVVPATTLFEKISTNRTLAYRTFPNPANNSLIYIEMLDNPEEGYVELINLQGKKIFREHLSNNLATFSTKHLPAGIYLIRIKTMNGEIVSRISINP